MTVEGYSVDSPEGARQFVVVHVGLALALAPAARHLVRVGELELAVRALPRDARGVGRIGEQLQEELPELDLAAPDGRRPRPGGADARRANQRARALQEAEPL